MEDKRFQYRMYFFVPYNLSPIQQAIQAGHAGMQYVYGHMLRPEMSDFMENDKTWIVLNGGTTNNTYEEVVENGVTSKVAKGTLNQIRDQLQDKDIYISSFYEPDLNDALTAVCFLADERVWDYENYLDFYDWLIQIKMNSEYKYAMDLKNPQIRHMSYEQYKMIFPEYYDQWVKEILGGETNAFLRNIIKNKKLA